MTTDLPLPISAHIPAIASRERRQPPVAFDCPWCLEPGVVDEATYRSDAFRCPSCAVAIEWAPDPASSAAGVRAAA